MTINEGVKRFIAKTTGNVNGNLSQYYCGMTNNPKRRRKEHGAIQLIDYLVCKNKDAARDLLRQLSDTGFDVDNDIMSGLDDSKIVYVYRKTSLTIQKLCKSVELNFQQRWYSEDNLDQIPNTNGIYCCYSCDKKLVNNTFKNSELLYIGLAANGFKSRISGHKSKDHAQWKKDQKMGADKQLVYAIAEFNSDILQTVEAALISENRPPENTEYIDGYQGEYHSITVNCTGYCGKLKKSITATYKQP